MDYRIVEFANRAADRATRSAERLRQGVVKDVARRCLPAEIVDRRKSGFGVPLARWFRASDGLGAAHLGAARQPGGGSVRSARARAGSSPSTAPARTITPSCCGRR